MILKILLLLFLAVPCFSYMPSLRGYICLDDINKRNNIYNIMTSTFSKCIIIQESNTYDVQAVGTSTAKYYINFYVNWESKDEIDRDRLKDFIQKIKSLPSYIEMYIEYFNSNNDSIGGSCKPDVISGIIQ